MASLKNNCIIFTAEFTPTKTIRTIRIDNSSMGVTETSQDTPNKIPIGYSGGQQGNNYGNVNNEDTLPEVSEPLGLPLTPLAKTTSGEIMDDQLARNLAYMQSAEVSEIAGIFCSRTNIVVLT